MPENTNFKKDTGVKRTKGSKPRNKKAMRGYSKQIHNYSIKAQAYRSIALLKNDGEKTLNSVLALKQSRI